MSAVAVTPVRRSWLARRRNGWRVAARLAAGGVRTAPGRALLTVIALTIGVALMAVDQGRGSVEASAMTIGLTFVTVTALAAARIPDPARLRTSAVLDLVGSRPSIRRRIAMVDVGLSAVVAVGLGVPVGVLATQIDGGDGPRWQAAAVIGLLVPVVLAALVGGGYEVSLVRSARTASRARLSATARIIAAGILVLCGVALPGSARSWFDLDVTLVPGLFLVGMGLALIAPMLAAVAGQVLARAARWPSAHLAGALVRARRRALGPAVSLVAAGSAAVVVQSVLGAGLVARETHRRASLSVQAGTRADQVIIDAVSIPRSLVAVSPTSGPPARDYEAMTLEQVARVAKAAPGAIVAPVVVPVSVPMSLGQVDVSPYLSFFKAVSVDGTDVGSGRVALATPQLTNALGLERFEGDLAAGRVLVLDPSVPVRNGVVRLTSGGTNGTGAGSAFLPARVVGGPAIPTRVPAAIVAESALQSRGLRIGTQRVTFGAVVRLSHPASEADVRAIASAVPASEVFAGDSVDVDRLERTRLDAASSVVVRSSADVRRGVLLVGLAGVVALVVGLRFAALAHRAEDDLFEVVGAPSATLRRIAAWHGAIVTIVGVGLGLSVGLIGTAWGIARYNSSGRGALPPIPFDVPGLLVLGLLVVPVAGAVAAWA